MSGRESAQPVSPDHGGRLEETALLHGPEGAAVQICGQVSQVMVKDLEDDADFLFSFMVSAEEGDYYEVV